MRIIDLIGFVLEKGCGKRLDEIKKKIEDQKEGLQTLSDDLKIAYYTGPLVVGELLRKYSESETLKIARRRNTDYQRKIELCFLLRATGEELIRTAVETLPERIIRLAGKWRRVEASEQEAIAKEVTEVWKDRLQQGIDIVADPYALERFETQANLRFDTSSYLPKQFGEPNCLGREIQLAAFATLAGANFYNCLVVQHLGRDDHRLSLGLTRKIKEDIEKRGIINDEAFAQSLDAHESAYKYLLRTEDMRFHGCVVMQLRNGEWIIIDPYGAVWGVLPSSMQEQMKKADRLLSKYRRVLPGLSFLVTSPKAGEQYERLLQASFEWIRKSKEAEVTLREVSDLDELISRLVERGVIDDLLEGPHFAHVKGLTSNPEAKRALAENIVRKDVFHFGGMKKKELLKRVIDEFLSYYHLIAWEKFGKAFDEMRKDGELVHPAIEVMSDSAFSVALSVTNAVAVSEFDTFEHAELLAQISYSQQVQNNVLLSKELELLQGLPIIKSSPMCEKCRELLEDEKVKHPIVEDTLERFKLTNL